MWLTIISMDQKCVHKLSSWILMITDEANCRNCSTTYNYPLYKGPLSSPMHAIKFNCLDQFPEPIAQARDQRPQAHVRPTSTHKQFASNVNILTCAVHASGHLVTTPRNAVSRYCVWNNSNALSSLVESTPQHLSPHPLLRIVPRLYYNRKVCYTMRVGYTMVFLLNPTWGRFHYNFVSEGLLHHGVG